MPYEDHKKQAQAPVTCAVITVSDTRTEADDKSGKIVREHLEASGHRVGSYQIVADDPDLIRRALASVADGRHLSGRSDQRRHRHCGARHDL